MRVCSQVVGGLLRLGASGGLLERRNPRQLIIAHRVNKVRCLSISWILLEQKAALLFQGGWDVVSLAVFVAQGIYCAVCAIRLLQCKLG